MDQPNEVVRKQLTLAINRKGGLLRRLDRQIEQSEKDLAAEKNHRAGVITEITALQAHLDELGGPIEKQKKGTK
jgi:hypothetical protein